MSKKTEELVMTRETLLADNEFLQQKLANLYCDFANLEQTFNTVTGAKWVRKKGHPQRVWIGLTDDEIDTICWGAGENDLLRAREIEAKLKEKNT